MYAITVTESVKTDNNIIGAKKLSGLLRCVSDTKFIKPTTNNIYPEALIAFISGFFDI